MVDIWFVATIIQRLKTVVLVPDVVHQLEDAQACGGIPSYLVRRRAGRSEDLLVSLLLGLCLAINRSRQQAVEGVVMVDCLPLFLGYMWAQVSLEREHAVST
eukprot:g24031.t1